MVCPVCKLETDDKAVTCERCQFNFLKGSILASDFWRYCFVGSWLPGMCLAFVYFLASSWFLHLAGWAPCFLSLILGEATSAIFRYVMMNRRLKKSGCQMTKPSLPVPKEDGEGQKQP